MSTKRTGLAGPIFLAAILGTGLGCDRPDAERFPVAQLSSEAASIIRQARVCDRAGRLEEALALYEDALAAEPRLLDARARAGELARRTGQPAEAARHAEALLEQLPDHAGARVLLARALAGTSHRRAVRVLEPVLAASPTDARAQLAAGEIALAGGDPSGAMRHLRNALRETDDAGLVLDAGRGMAHAGFHTDAIRAVELALEREDRTPHARYTLGWVLEHAERYEECVEEYRALLRDHPDYLPPYRNLGALMARDGELPRAIRIWEQGLERAPGDSGLSANLDEAMEALGLAIEGGRG